MISVNNVSVGFGEFDLFKDITFMVNPRDRIGLVGKNGAGKSTLLKLFLGIEVPGEGSVNVPNDLTLGYLPQHMTPADGKSVFDETKSSFKELLLLEKQIDAINTNLAERGDYESEEYLELINKMSELSERHSVLGGHTMNAAIEQVLIGLGFLRSEFKRPTAELSGGWRMRIELAKILLQKPDVLLLDEPTNHLDIESIQWLEDFLKDYHGAVILISHDRIFLDAISNRTIEISVGNIYDYKVPYSKFVVLRKERREQQMATYVNQQKMIESSEQFIEKFRYKATKAEQVQSRIKQLAKIDRIEIDPEDKASINFKFPPAPRAGDIVIEAKNLTKRYGDKLVLDNIDLIIERGEKIAFVGRNGEGKTTLSRIILKEIDYEGILKKGHNVSIGYFAQNQDSLLDEEKTVFETIDHAAVGDARMQMRSILGSFLFSGDTIDKKVKVLSGGERSRLALVKLLLQPYSLLVMDEPTNHLDMLSKDILKQALQQYNGTLILVSHDRDFLNGITSKIYEFKNKKISEHIGDIFDFLKKKKLASLKEIERKNKTVPNKKENKKSNNKPSYKEKKVFDNKINKLKRDIQKSEKNIGKIEHELKAIEEQLTATSENDNTYNDTVYLQHQKFQKKLENEMSVWELLNGQLEEQQKTTLY